ncbi:MAG: hypothetical protein IJ766_10900 [Clostridia bacterium]|nr:hypothetical protein [Clostridia bacterium]
MDYDFLYDFGDYGSSAVAGYASLFVGVYGIVLSISAALVSILSLIAMYKVFQKAGKPGWHAIIPILNIYDLFDIAWGKGILFLLLLIPLVNLVVLILLQLKLAKAFGKSTGFGVGLIFFEFIFMLILAFGDARYVGPDGVPQQPIYQAPYGYQPQQGGYNPGYQASAQNGYYAPNTQAPQQGINAPGENTEQ